jgi:hypothetical protein
VLSCERSGDQGLEQAPLRFFFWRNSAAKRRGPDGFRA